MGEAAGCGVLLGAMHQRSWMLERPPGCHLRGHRGLALEKQPTLQELRTGETCVVQSGPMEKLLVP